MIRRYKYLYVNTFIEYGHMQDIYHQHKGLVFRPVKMLTFSPSVVKKIFSSMIIATNEHG